MLNYCLSLYGCELYDLSNTDIENVCKAWRSGLFCRSAILCIATDTVPLFDLICKRSIMFVRRCLDSESLLVRSVAGCGVFHGQLASRLGRNVQTCCELFSLPKSSLLCGMSHSHLCDSIKTYRKQFYDSHMYSRALATLELIMLRQHILFVPQFSFSSSDYLHALIGVCT